MLGYLLQFLLRCGLRRALEELGDALRWSEQFGRECAFDSLAVGMGGSDHEQRGIVPDVMPESSGQGEPVRRGWPVLADDDKWVWMVGTPGAASRASPRADARLYSATADWKYRRAVKGSLDPRWVPARR